MNEAGQRKAAREEACPLFKTLSGREAKTLKFLETKATPAGARRARNERRVRRANRG